MLRTLILFALISTYSAKYLHAQNETNIWYFGNNAGLDFNTGVPVPLTDGQMATHEGCASICDSNGSLLFYTNGVNVWNKNHQIMPNGTGLLGHNSSTQSAIIVPFPGYSNLYYIFCTNGFGAGFTYSLLDMNLDNGLGDVTGEKNTFLFLQTTEKLTAVKHANGNDFWVIIHEQYSDKFLAYLVDSYGVRPPVISAGGDSLYDFSIGQMKISPNGKRIAFAHTAEAIGFTGKSFVFDFDNLTGKISNPKRVSDQHFNPGPYGIEFSPSSNLLYTTEIYAISPSQSIFSIYQYDINAADIKLSEKTIYKTPTSGYVNDKIASLQLGPNGKIYVAVLDDTALAVIQNPDLTGTACNFGFKKQGLNGRTSRLGLPNSIPSNFSKSDFTFENTCYNDTTKFYAQVNKYDSLLWNFNNSNSGSANISALKYPYHIFSDTGIYNVRLIVYKRFLKDTIIKQVHIIGAKINLGSDTSICTGDKLILSIPLNNAQYTWQDGSHQSSYTVNHSGTFSVSVNIGTCTITDTLKVREQQKPIVYIGNDTLLCKYDTITLRASVPQTTYNWQNGSTDSIFIVRQKGIYWLKVSNSGCSATDSIGVNYLMADLGNDSVLCSGQSLFLNAQNPGSAILWNTGDTTRFIQAKDSGWYWVRITQANCTEEDSVLIQFEDCNDCKLWVPSAFSPNNDGVNDKLLPLGNCEYHNYMFRVYNRWGELVFKSTEQTQGWDGRYKSDEQATDTYTWILEYNDKKNDIHYFKGVVVLLK